MDRDQDLISVSAHMGVLRRRWPIIVVFALVGAIIGVAVSMAQPERYQAEAKILVAQGVTTSTGGAMDPEEVATQAEVVLSDPVINEVISSLGLEQSRSDLVEATTVEASESTRVIVITAAQGTAELAADVANAFAQGYIELKATQLAESQTAVSDAYNARIVEIEDEITALRAEVVGVGPARAAAIRATITALASRHSELRTALLLAEEPTVQAGTGGQVLQVATDPSSPAAPRPVWDGLLGAFLGLVVGTLVAYLVDRRRSA